jgi:membrane-associated phospholipid phosphatase
LKIPNTNEEVRSVTVEIIKFVQSFSSPFWDNVFQVITNLGEESIYIVILGFIFWCVDKKYGYRLAFLFLCSSLVNGFIKDIFKAERPLAIKELRHLRVETATGYSFPSGHTQNITSFVVVLVKNYRNIYMYIGGSLAILMVGISRLYLGVHWPRDVFGGIFFGIICVVCADYIFDYIHSRKNKYIFFILPILIIIGIFLINGSADLFKSAGVFCSFQIGYVIEDTYIKFTTKNKPSKQIIKLLLGIGGALLFKSVIKQILPLTPFSDFIRYFIVGIWITVISPLIFKYFKLAGSESEIQEAYVKSSKV